jgi:hypothetical protein
MRDVKDGRKTQPKRSNVSTREDRSNHAGLAALAIEMAAYHAHLPRLLREHGGEFVLIKGDDIVGVFADRSSALEEGYRRFGIVSFLVREITAAEPVIYLPNVVP